MCNKHSLVYKVFPLLIAFMLAMTACDNSQQLTSESTVQDTKASTTTTTATAQMTTATQITEAPQTSKTAQTEVEPSTVLSVEHVVVAERPLAGGALLIAEEVTVVRAKADGGSWEKVDLKYSILYAGSEEPEFLYECYFESDDIWRDVVVSPDLTRVVYFSDTFGHRGGIVSVLDVTKRTVFTPFDEITATYQFAPIRFIWLDDEIMLTIIAFAQGSATAGGSVHYYSFADGASESIIPQGNHFQFSELKIDGNELVLTAALDRGNANYHRDYMHEVKLQLMQIYEAIRTGSTITLDNIPNPADNISREAAIEIAVNHLADRNVTVELQTINKELGGRSWLWKVEFKGDDRGVYRLEIDACDGEVIKFETEWSSR